MMMRSRALKVGGGIALTLGVFLFVHSQMGSAQQRFRLRPQMPGKPIVTPLDNGAVYLRNNGTQPPPIGFAGGAGGGGGGFGGGGGGFQGGGFGGGGRGVPGGGRYGLGRRRRGVGSGLGQVVFW